METIISKHLHYKLRQQTIRKYPRQTGCNRLNRKIYLMMADIIKIRRWLTNGRQRMIYSNRTWNSTPLRKATNCSLRLRINSNSSNNKNKILTMTIQITITNSNKMKSARLRIKQHTKIKIYIKIIMILTERIIK